MAAVAGTQVTGSSFLSAISTIYDYSYLSSTTLAAATASLASGATTAAAYSAATSPAAVSASVAAVDVRLINAALYCTYLNAATNSSNITAANQYSTLCLAPASPPPPPASLPPMDYTWLAPLIICSIFGILLFALAAAYVAKRRLAEARPRDRYQQPVVDGVHVTVEQVASPVWSGLALTQQYSWTRTLKVVDGIRVFGNIKVLQSEHAQN